MLFGFALLGQPGSSDGKADCMSSGLRRNPGGNAAMQPAGI
jgi:hypothetical protein